MQPPDGEEHGRQTPQGPSLPPAALGEGPGQLLTSTTASIQASRGRETETTSRQEWFFLAFPGEELRPGWDTGRNVTV